MNEKQRHRWERVRAKGRARFILLYGVLLWGGLGGTGIALIHRGESILDHMLGYALWGLFGYLSATIGWSMQEKQYQQYIDKRQPDAPIVLAVLDDLFFVAKLQETAKQVGAKLQTVLATKFRPESLREAKPALAIFDLNAASANPVELIRQLKADAELKQIPVVAFLSHVQVDLQRAAQAAGCDQVMPRSKFTAELPALLRQFVS